MMTGTLLLLGGCILNIFVTGMLFRPHDFYKSRYEHKLNIVKLKSKLVNSSYDNKQLV